VAGFAASAAGQGASFLGQQSQAKAQEQEFKQNQLNAQQAYADSSQAISTNQMQVQDQASQQRQQDDMATRAAQATAMAGAAAGGVQGISVNELVGSFSAKDALAKTAIDTNEQWQIAQGQAEKVAQGDSQVNHINSRSPGVQPSPISAGLGIISGGINAAQGLARVQTQQGGAPMNLNPFAAAGLTIPGFGNPFIGR
jgi:hypothetical protein